MLLRLEYRTCYIYISVWQIMFHIWGMWWANLYIILTMHRPTATTSESIQGPCRVYSRRFYRDSHALLSLPPSPPKHIWFGIQRWLSWKCTGIQMWGGWFGCFRETEHCTVWVPDYSEAQRHSGPETFFHRVTRKHCYVDSWLALCVWRQSVVKQKTTAAPFPTAFFL